MREQTWSDNSGHGTTGLLVTQRLVSVKVNVAAETWTARGTSANVVEEFGTIASADESRTASIAIINIMTHHRRSLSSSSTTYTSCHYRSCRPLPPLFSSRRINLRYEPGMTWSTLCSKTRTSRVLPRPRRTPTTCCLLSLIHSNLIRLRQRTSCRENSPHSALSYASHVAIPSQPTDAVSGGRNRSMPKKVQYLLLPQR